MASKLWKEFQVSVCPKCGSDEMVQPVKHDGGYECLSCQSPTHESWFWPELSEEEASACMPTHTG